MTRARGSAPFAGEAATDLLIVGGGPAGLATAIRARLAGLSVRVLERAQPPVDKACGEGLMPDAVRCLAEMGVELPAGESRCFRGIRYLDGEVIAEGVFPCAGTPGAPGATGGETRQLREPAADSRLPAMADRLAGGLGVRRLVLHRALAARAEQLGAELCWGVAALALEPAAAAPNGGSSQAVRGVLTARGLAEARWVVGADGLRSRVRAWAGCDTAPGRRAPPPRHSYFGAPPLRRFGMRQHFAVEPWCDVVEVYWGPGCEAYVTPTAPGEVGVALLWSEAEERVGFDGLLTRFPALVERLAGAPAASRVRGCGPLRQRAGAVARGNVALVGDAAGYLDAITGEGIAVALHQSAALVAALAAPGGADLERYAAAHARIGRLPDTMTSAVLALERRPWLRRRAVRALAAEPALFSRLLGIHARTLPPAGLGFDGALRLVYRLITA
jgi:menaquinone-9 beta-reductase